jgi:hypothetical protein
VQGYRDWGKTMRRTKKRFYIILLKNNFRTMYREIRDLIFHPDAFFARLTKEKPGPMLPFLIIIISACLNIAGLMLAQILPGMINFDKTGNLTFTSTLIYYVVIFCIVPLLDWGIISIGFYCISRLVLGRGSLMATFRNAGYGMLPWIIFTTISSVYAIISLLIHNPMFPFFHVLMGGSAPPFMEGSTPTLIIFLFSFSCYLWMFYLWILGMKYSYQIKFWKAAGIVLIPVIILLLLDQPAWIIVGKYIFFGF